jgi:hypothetical protein
MLHNKKVVARMFLLITIAAFPGRAQGRNGKYSATQVFTLRREANGVNGTIELLMDKRLTKPVREDLWGNGDWSYVFPASSALYKELAALPPAKAELRIIGTDGRLIAERKLDTPLAKLQPWSPGVAGSHLFLLTQDYSVGVGSYDGPVTVLLRVSDGTLEYVKVLNPESGREEPIRLMKSLKSDWRISSRKARGGEILSRSCHPREDGQFVIDYVRYYSTGTRWREYKREKKGFWESDDPFPPRSAFP